mgnify:CR=1 FL=1
MRHGKSLKSGVVKALIIRGQNPENRVFLRAAMVYLGVDFDFGAILNCFAPFCTGIKTGRTSWTKTTKKDSLCGSGRKQSGWWRRIIRTTVAEAARILLKRRECFPNVIVSTMKGMLDTFENRMANLLFKNAVELSMLLHVVSATHDIDGDTLEELKALCSDEVKRLNGSVSLAEAWKFQRRIDDKLEKE